LLYLGEIIRDTTGKESLAGFDRVTSPRTTTDNQGHFVFANVRPGRYGLFLDTVVRAFLLLKPDSEDALIIEVSAGKETNLDTLLYDSLPISLEPKPYP
jgi:hypothetical protein